MVWGLGQPSAAHWRQWRERAAAIGLNVGQNVAAMGYLLNGVSRHPARRWERLAHPRVCPHHDDIVTRTLRVSEADPQQQGAALLDFLNPSGGGGPQTPRQRPFVGFDRHELNT